MMGKYEDLKENMEKLEEKLKACDPEKDSAVILKIKEKIVAVMFKMNDETLEYLYKDCFMWMAGKSEVYFQGGAIAIEDVMLKVASEVWRLYDPNQGHLMPFIIERTEKRTIDIIKSKSKILKNEVSLEGLSASSEDINRQEMAERILSDQEQGKDIDTPEKKYVISRESEEAFCDEASNLLRFVNGSQNRRLTIRKLLWTANYSDDVFLTVLSDQVTFNHERDVFKAMNLNFINHCLDVADTFSSIDDISVNQLKKSRTRLLAEVEWIPQKMPKPIVRDGEMIHYPPSGNKVYCGYLAQKENTVRSEGTVSVERGKYLDWKKNLLGKDSSII